MAMNENGPIRLKVDNPKEEFGKLELEFSTETLGAENAKLVEHFQGQRKIIEDAMKAATKEADKKYNGYLSNDYEKFNEELREFARKMNQVIEKSKGALKAIIDQQPESDKNFHNLIAVNFGPKLETAVKNWANETISAEIGIAEKRVQMLADAYNSKP